MLTDNELQILRDTGNEAAVNEIVQLRTLVRDFMEFLEPMRFGRPSDDAKAAQLDEAARMLLGPNF